MEFLHKVLHIFRIEGAIRLYDPPDGQPGWGVLLQRFQRGVVGRGRPGHLPTHPVKQEIAFRCWVV